MSIVVWPMVCKLVPAILYKTYLDKFMQPGVLHLESVEGVFTDHVTGTRHVRNNWVHFGVHRHLTQAHLTLP